MKPTSYYIFDCNTIWLKYGDENNNVKHLNFQLRDMGYNVSRDTEIVFDSLTRDAVKSFQTKVGITIDGIFGKQTCQKWNSYYNSMCKASEISSADLNLINCDTVNIRKGTVGTAVTVFQTVLHELGYYDGLINGIVGAITEASIKKVQSELNLASDGWIGSVTCPAIKKLYADKIKQDQSKNEKQKLSKAQRQALIAKRKAEARKRAKERKEETKKVNKLLQSNPVTFIVDDFKFTSTDQTQGNNVGNMTWSTVDMLNDKVKVYQGHSTAAEFDVIVPIHSKKYKQIENILIKRLKNPVVCMGNIVHTGRYAVSFTRAMGKGAYYTLKFHLIEVK